MEGAASAESVCAGASASSGVEDGDGAAVATAVAAVMACLDCGTLVSRVVAVAWHTAARGCREWLLPDRLRALWAAGVLPVPGG